MSVELSLNGWEMACLALVLLSVVIFAFIGGMHVGMGIPEACDLCQQQRCTGACRKGGYR